jgi:hypothetical protein
MTNMFRRELRQFHGSWFGHVRAKRKEAVDAIKEAEEMHLDRAGPSPYVRQKLDLNWVMRASVLSASAPVFRFVW